MTWSELIRKLKTWGYKDLRAGRGSHRHMVHETTGELITVSVHTKQEVGTGLASKILKDAREKATPKPKPKKEE